jgi:hypothetical protein
MPLAFGLLPVSFIAMKWRTVSSETARGLGILNSIAAKVAGEKERAMSSASVFIRSFKSD